MGIRAAYGPKENIQAAIYAGIIPRESILFTSDKNDTTEVFFYDQLGALKKVSLSVLEDEYFLSFRTQINSKVNELVERDDQTKNTLKQLTELFGKKELDFNNSISELETKVAETVTGLSQLQAQVEELSKGGVTEETIIEKLNNIEDTVSTLCEEKISCSEVQEVQSDELDSVFYGVFKTQS